MITAVYKRASDEKQDEDGVSIEMQHDTIQKFCEYRGFDKIKEYTEIRSARSLKGRTQLLNLLEDVKKGRVKRIIVFKLDRLSRSLRDLMNILHTLDEFGCELHSTHENIDTSTPSGRMLVQVLGMIAEWESANISLRVRSAMKLKAHKDGIWQGSTPFGFDLVEQRLVLNEEEAAIIREGFSIVLSGNSFKRAEEVIRTKYNLDFYDGFLIKKLTAHSTVGDLYRDGDIKEDAFPGIITKTERDKLLTILEENRPARKGVYEDDLFRRKIICYECGTPLVLSVNKSEKDGRPLYNYSCDKCYRKTRRTFSISEKRLEEAFSNYIRRMTIDFDESDIKEDDSMKEKRKLLNQLKSLEKQKHRIQKAWIQRMMSDADLDKHQEEIENEMKEVKSKLDQMKVKRVGLTKEEILEIKESLSSHFEQMSKLEKRDFIQRHIKEIHIERKLLKGFTKKHSLTLTDVVFF